MTMSYTKSVTIWCDGPFCANWIGAEGAIWKWETARSARKMAKRAGWVRKGNKDLCPECARRE